VPKQVKGRNISCDGTTGKIVSIGKDYEERIIRLLTTKPGLAPHQIGKRLYIHRVSASRHLSDLKMKNIVYNIGNKYYLSNSSLNQIYWFATKMDLNSSGLALSFNAIEKNDPHYYLSSNSSYYTTPMGVLESQTRGTSPSPAFCKTLFTDRDTDENHLFEFVNRMGAYIVYLFIQSMMPFSLSTQTKHNHQERNEHVEILLKYAIDLRWWYEHFRKLFGNSALDNHYRTSLTKDIADPSNIEDKVHYYELDRKRFNRLCRIFESLYPDVYKGLEESWIKTVEDTVKVQQYFASKIEKGPIKKVRCDHSWTKTKIYKYPKKCYICIKCHSLSHSNSKPCPEPENMPIELIMSRRSDVQLSRNIDS
jgi:hypothetical protein